MRVLGVDAASKNIGWCVLDTMTKKDSWYKSSGVLKASPKLVADKNTTSLEVSIELMGRFLSIMTKSRCDFMVMEGYAYQSGQLADAVQLGTLLRYAAYGECLEMTVAPATLKGFVLGKGQGKKEVVMLGVYKRWGFEPENSDEADAYALAMFGIGAFSPVDMPDNCMRFVSGWQEKNPTAWGLIRRKLDG